MILVKESLREKILSKDPVTLSDKGCVSEETIDIMAKMDPAKEQ